MKTLTFGGRNRDGGSSARGHRGGDRPRDRRDDQLLGAKRDGQKEKQTMQCRLGLEAVFSWDYRELAEIMRHRSRLQPENSFATLPPLG